MLNDLRMRQGLSDKSGKAKDRGEEEKEEEGERERER